MTTYVKQAFNYLVPTNAETNTSQWGIGIGEGYEQDISDPMSILSYVGINVTFPNNITQSKQIVIQEHKGKYRLVFSGTNDTGKYIHKMKHATKNTVKNILTAMKYNGLPFYNVNFVKYYP